MRMSAARLAAGLLVPLLLCAGASAAPEIAVDPRLELLGVIQRLAGRETFSPEDAAYARAVDARFGPFRGHPAVRLYAELAAGPDDPLGVILLHYSNPPELALKDPEAAVPFADTEQGGERVLSFLLQLRDFAAASDFPGFFRENQPRYRAVENAAREELGSLDPEAVFGRYAGLDLQVRCHYALSLLYTPRMRNSFIIPYPDVALLGRHQGPFDVWTMFQHFSGKAARDRAGFAAFKVPSPELWQESLFVFVEPALYYFENLRPFDPASFYGPEAAVCRGDRLNCVKSGLVAALLERLGAGAPRPPVVKPDYAGALRERLKEYESDRVRYPTLWEFMPRLMSVYPELASRPAANPLAGVVVPAPRKSSDFFSAEMLALPEAHR
jgi:hypothetical protein